MNELKIFKNPTFGSFRIIKDAASNQLLFCATDVCKALGYTNNRKAIADHVSEDDVTKRYTTDNLNREQQTTYVTESGLYSLIFSSKLERAKEFKRWVTSEVLPAIRKDGGYMVSKEDESEEDLMARALVVAKATLQRRDERIKQLENENKQKSQTLEVQSAQIKELNHAVEEMQPKISYLDTILQCKDTMTITQIAQDYGLSAKAFNKILENYRVQRKVNGSWIVYAPYLQKGYVQSETFTFTHTDGTQGARLVTKWTQKGRLFLYEQLKKKSIIPLIEKPQA